MEKSLFARAPSDCVQYFTGATGSVKSYNFQGGQLLASQYYTNCIRTEKGYCGKTKLNIFLKTILLFSNSMERILLNITRSIQDDSSSHSCGRYWSTHCLSQQFHLHPQSEVLKFCFIKYLISCCQSWWYQGASLSSSHIRILLSVVWRPHRSW